LYSGAKGTMTPNNRLQRTALPRGFDTGCHDRSPGSALGQCPRDAGEKGLGMDRVHRRQEDVGKN
jgi:hypothetical protein